MNGNNPYQNFTDLAVWQSARHLKNNIFELTKNFPVDEKFRLSDQLIRSSRSVNTNIAEGHGRYSYKDQLRFCIQARGSLSEIHNHLIDAQDCNYLSNEQMNDVMSIINETGKLLNGYISYLRKNINASND